MRAWAPEGHRILVEAGGALLLVEPGSGTVDTLARNSSGEGAFSPDGRWLAWVSDETGGPEVYVAPWPGRRGKWQVSQNGGSFPRWAGRTGELFFLAGDTVMVTRAGTGAAGFAEPRPLFAFGNGDLEQNGFVVSPDGQRLLYPAPAPDAAASEIHVVLNWTELLRKLAARR